MPSQDSNGFRMDGTSGIRAVYAKAAMINHDCAPNCRTMFDMNKHVHIFAKRDIDPGEEITVTYCSPLLGTPVRREKLQRNKFFVCQCQRCEDPTELGSNMSSLLCPKCKTGLLTLKGDVYGCGGGCPFTTSKEKSDKFAQSISKIHDKLLDPEEVDKGLRTSMEKTTRVGRMEEMLTKHSRYDRDSTN
jgi:uncharacterized Zn finger protein (UPF0148 family)